MRLKVVSIINLKGGVGKTFTSYNMAYELHKRGFKVLILDNDKQGNISKAAATYNPNGECAMARVLKGMYSSPLELVVKSPQYENIDIITSNMSLMQAVYEVGNSTENQIGSYKKLIEMPIDKTGKTIQDEYDYMIIDNPPDITFNVISALKITDEVIVPVKIDEWSLEGLDIIAEQIRQAKFINNKIKMLGVVVTMYKNNDANIAGLEWLEKKSRVPVLAKIRYTEKATESTFFNKPIYEYSPRCSAAQDYKRFITCYLQETRSEV